MCNAKIVCLKIESFCTSLIPKDSCPSGWTPNLMDWVPMKSSIASTQYVLLSVCVCVCVCVCVFKKFQIRLFHIIRLVNRNPKWSQRPRSHIPSLIYVKITRFGVITPKRGILVPGPKFKKKFKFDYFILFD